MRIRNTIVSLALAASALVGSSANAAVIITVGDATADQGATATFDVTLSGVAGGAAANNAQIDIIFSTAVFDVSAGTVCTANARVANLRHTETLPTSPAVPANSKRLRLNIIDADGSGRVTDGVLYTCAFPVKADAPAGAATLDGGRVNVGDTSGNILASGDAAAVDGTVTVNGGTVPCVVPTPNPTPASGVFIQTGGSSRVAPGESVTFSVTLAGVAGGALANNAQVDIIFSTEVFDVTSGAVCTANSRVANLRHTETLPSSPAVPANSKRLRLNIIDADGSGRVTDGELYSCTFPVLAGAPEGTVTLDGGRVNVGDTAGNILASGDAAAVDGLVAVCAGGGPVDTPTSTPTSTPTNSPIPPTFTPTNTPTITPIVPTNTPTRPAPTRTPTQGQQPQEEDEDGCQMTSNASSNSWALFVPVMMVLALRRRAR